MSNDTIPILRTRRSRVLLGFVLVAAPVLVMYLARDSDVLFLALPAGHAAGWLVAIANALYWLRFIVLAILRGRVIVAGSQDFLKIDAISKGVANPRVQYLTGDLSDVKMSIKALSADFGIKTMRDTMENDQLSEVVFSGSAGTIRLKVTLGSLEDEYEERFAEWKRSLGTT